jgi:membrane-associated phospholipid phosphatase
LRHLRQVMRGTPDMSKLRPILAANRNFFFCYLFFFLVGLFFLGTEGKAGSFIRLNPYHANLLDHFFAYFTFLGDGIFSLIVFLLLLAMRRWMQAWEVIAAFVISALLAQLLKNLFSMPRPFEFFRPGEYGYFINGVTRRGFASFPSGHSTTVFALATLLALFEKNKKWNILYALGAVAVGYSRIYLGQHFLTDVVCGSALGVLTGGGVHWFFTVKWPRRMKVESDSEGN